MLIDNKADINVCKYTGSSPLYVACDQGHIGIVQMLIINNADTKKCSQGGISPLYAACWEGHTEVVKMLIINGADPNMCSDTGKNSIQLFSMFMFTIFAVLCRTGMTKGSKDVDIRVVRSDNELEEDDKGVDKIMNTLQDVCIYERPDKTVQQLLKDTNAIIRNIEIYKEVVKRNKILKKEIKWIIEESKGHREVSRITDLLKQDITRE
ncbi:uncharacterized protein LOC143048864 [Mytilus galloprovincialis]|uniref:uncharacterized protein LOC143048864 n=1 Tax=Mytilus galloprovincialis TaxID=29158 RepID=UPI003F7BC61C